MSVVAIVPAYNEVDEVPRAVAGLRAQTTPPDRIIVAVNNCRDPRLVEAAADTGADVVDLGPCPGLKAEALNRVVEPLLVDDDTLVLVTDADTVLAPTWITTALAHLDGRTVVGGLFAGEPGGGLLGAEQRNEYSGYTREVYARGDRAWVLTGTATMIPATALRALHESRGYVYDTDVSTEDFEVTVALRMAGWRTVSPVGCEVVTEVMPTVRALLAQRTRWYRGAIETLRKHGWNRVTARYMLQQATIALGAVLSLVAALLLVVFVATGAFTVTAWWLIALIPLAARVVAAQHKWQALLVLPSLAYDALLQVALVRGWWTALTGRRHVWNTNEGV